MGAFSFVETPNGLYASDRRVCMYVTQLNHNPTDIRVGVSDQGLTAMILPDMPL